MVAVLLHTNRYLSSSFANALKRQVVALQTRRRFTVTNSANGGADVANPFVTVEHTDPRKPRTPLDDSSIDKSTFTKRIEITMPALDMGRGKVVKWYKKPGDLVQCEDVLCDIEMQGVAIGLQMDDEVLGLMGKIIVPEGGDEVEENGVIATVFHQPESADEILESSATEQTRE